MPEARGLISGKSPMAMLQLLHITQLGHPDIFAWPIDHVTQRKGKQML